MDMQREDFLALTRGPMGYDMNGEPGYYGNKTFIKQPYFKGVVPVIGSARYYNQCRILQDQFPAGTIFEFLGTTCFSRGIAQPNKRQEPSGSAYLRVLAPAKEGGMEEVLFSVREALSIAKQISVDTINRMNGVNHREP
jgi:hypothetical protein